MPRVSNRSSYIDRPIEREEVTHTRTVAMPFGGFKNARVISTKITLPKIPARRSPDEDPDT